MIRIVADEHIPYLRDALKPLAQQCDLIFIQGDSITPQLMRDTDILLTRTRTRCDASLLEDSRCSLIATATIGCDHIDLDYCRSKSIEVANAPGCNAPAVAQYVLAAIKALLQPSEKLSDKTLGIIGVGNVGSILDRWARGLGMKTLFNDPPLQSAQLSQSSQLSQSLHSSQISFSSLERIAEECDIISVHTPLTHSGPYPTFHLLSTDFLSSLKRRPIIINAARGPVADSMALISAKESGLISSLVIDCWEGEPDINRRLLELTDISTPHIAGYSLEGKIRATRAVLEALDRHLTRHLNLPSQIGLLTSGLPYVSPIPDIIGDDQISYDIVSDSRRLKSAANPAEAFEHLRNGYSLRPEPSNLPIPNLQPSTEA